MQKRNHTRAELRDRLIERARKRGRDKGLPATVQVKDLIWPKLCPVLGIELNYDFSGGFMGAYPSLDRFKPELGYVAGNVFIISHRANTLKNNGTLEEFKKIVRYLRHRPVHSQRGIYKVRQHHIGQRSKVATTKFRGDAAAEVLKNCGRVLNTFELAAELKINGVDIDLSTGTSGFVHLLLRDGRFIAENRLSRRQPYKWRLLEAT